MDERLREVERAHQVGDVSQEALQLARCRAGQHIERAATADGHVLFYCPVCGHDFVVQGVMATFLDAGQQENADYYLHHTRRRPLPPLMRQREDGKWEPKA